MCHTTGYKSGEIMGSRFGTFCAAVVLGYGSVLAGCSQGPKEPAPVFMLPASKVVGGPVMEGEATAPPIGQAATRQLRYVAVPPGQRIGGMAQARVVLKQAKATPHRARHAHNAKGALRAKAARAPATDQHRPNVAAKSPASGVPASMILLDEPVASGGFSPAEQR